MADAPKDRDVIATAAQVDNPSYQDNLKVRKDSDGSLWIVDAQGRKVMSGVPADQRALGATTSVQGVVNVTAGDLSIFSVGPTGVIPTANSIGLAGQQGFGVGVCPVLPAGYAALPGTTDPTSDNYGNYQYSDGSVIDRKSTRLNSSH